MDEMGIAEIMPTYYANRMKRFAEQGFVEAGGHSFTPKGQSHSTAYLEQQGLGPKTAIKRAQSAQSLLDKRRARNYCRITLHMA